MKEKKLKVGDTILLIAFKTLEAKGDIDVETVTNWGCRIKDNTTGIESFVSNTELKEWNQPKTIEVINEINGVETIESNNLYYPTKWVRKRFDAMSIANKINKAENAKINSIQEDLKKNILEVENNVNN